MHMSRLPMIATTSAILYPINILGDAETVTKMGLRILSRYGTSVPSPMTYMTPSPLGSSTRPRPVPTGAFLGAIALHLPPGILRRASLIIRQLSHISSILTR